jgi:hypothetical protein
MAKWEFTIKVIGEGSTREEALSNAVEFLAHASNDGRLDPETCEYLYDEYEVDRG